MEFLKLFFQVGLCFFICLIVERICLAIKNHTDTFLAVHFLIFSIFLTGHLFLTNF